MSSIKNAKASSSSRPKDIPPLIHIPKAMFTKKLLRKNSQIGCQLLSLPGEIQLNIIHSGTLGVFDKACLMLTCKSFAMLVCNPAQGLVQEGEMTSGDEDHQLEYQAECVSGWDSDGEAEDEYMALRTKFAQRTDRSRVAKFYRCLDVGWNQSSMRFCYGCGKFKSTEQKYWDKKVQRWLHNELGTISERYQQLSDCHCGCGPGRFVEAWVQYGKDKGKEVKAGDYGSHRTWTDFWYLTCPECMLSNRCDGCECCAEMMGCGCGTCHGWKRRKG